MNLRIRKILDSSATAVSLLSILLMTVSLLVLLGPIFVRGASAFFFRATVEHRRLQWEKFHHGQADQVKREIALANKARRPVYEMIDRFEGELGNMSFEQRAPLRRELKEVKETLRDLLGPFPGGETPVLPRQQYGQIRWDRALIGLNRVLFSETWNYADPRQMGKKVLLPRAARFQGTALVQLFPYIQNNLANMLRPRLTLYLGFFTQDNIDTHFFGGIWPEMLGTFYLTLGAMFFALPMGLFAAIYLSEFAGSGPLLSLLRACISTLAGVPSIVFGLFGLAFFINTVHISASKSVLAGSLTLSLLILPTIIRASEEAIRAVPHTYREAALSLGASRLRTVFTVVLPAALPGILTGSVISMGRAAGETAPIIFTAAVSVGKPLRIWETLTQPTPALSWNIYNIATEHQAVDQIRHVQFGMVLTLVLLVLLLNLSAIFLRARVSRKLRG